MVVRVSCVGKMAFGWCNDEVARVDACAERCVISIFFFKP